MSKPDPPLLLLAVCLAGCGHTSAISPRPAGFHLPAPAWASWPWPKAVVTEPQKGVRHWYDTSSPDGSTLDLIEFDFAKNPGLRLEMYDQDMDDAKPFDGRADYYAMGVGQATRHLNEAHPGRVVAAWNGSFFSYDFRERGQQGIARHVGQAVLDGIAHYNVGNPRWTFGVKATDAGPQFKVLYQPAYKELAGQFDFAASGAQYVVRDGQAMKLQRPPKSTDAPVRQPVPCGPDEAGHIPWVDFIRTSRTSMGWSKDSLKFYLLIVREPDNEVESKLAVKYGEPERGGWALADIQRFWLAFGAWNAVNIDGGIVTQMACLRPDGKYDLLPPGSVSPPKQRLIAGDDFKDAPAGGTLMYFYVRDAKAPRAGSTTKRSR